MFAVLILFFGVRFSKRKELLPIGSVAGCKGCINNDLHFVDPIPGRIN